MGRKTKRSPAFSTRHFKNSSIPFISLTPRRWQSASAVYINLYLSARSRLLSLSPAAPSFFTFIHWSLSRQKPISAVLPLSPLLPKDIHCSSPPLPSAASAIESVNSALERRRRQYSSACNSPRSQSSFLPPFLSAHLRSFSAAASPLSIPAPPSNSSLERDRTAR